MGPSMAMLQFGAAINFPEMPSKLLVGWLVGFLVGDFVAVDVGLEVVGIAIGLAVGLEVVGLAVVGAGIVTMFKSFVGDEREEE